MTEQIKEIKRQFRDIYGFIPCGGTQDEPLFNNVSNGIYLMIIDGRKTDIVILDGKISIEIRLDNVAQHI